MDYCFDACQWRTLNFLTSPSHHCPSSDSDMLSSSRISELLWIKCSLLSFLTCHILWVYLVNKLLILPSHPTSLNPENWPIPLLGCSPFSAHSRLPQPVSPDTTFSMCFLSKMCWHFFFDVSAFLISVCVGLNHYFYILQRERK